MVIDRVILVCCVHADGECMSKLIDQWPGMLSHCSHTHTRPSLSLSHSLSSLLL